MPAAQPTGLTNPASFSALISPPRSPRRSPHRSPSGRLSSGLRQAEAAETVKAEPCQVCGSDDVRVDEVQCGGRLLLVECGRCDHRSTSRLEDASVSRPRPPSRLDAGWLDAGRLDAGPLQTGQPRARPLAEVATAA